MYFFEFILYSFMLVSFFVVETKCSTSIFSRMTRWFTRLCLIPGFLGLAFGWMCMYVLLVLLIKGVTTVLAAIIVTIIQALLSIVLGIHFSAQAKS